MKKNTAPKEIVGLDVGDKHSVFCALDNKSGDLVEEGRVPTTKKGLTTAFGRRARARVALEAGTHSAWIADVLEELGHEVLVANPRELERITKSDRKNDRNDAELLARLARADATLLSPIKHRPKELRADLAVIRARDTLVQSRTKLINAVRGLVKSAGDRLTKCSASSFHNKAPEQISAKMHPAVHNLITLIKQTTDAIKAHDEMVEDFGEKKYPEVTLLTAVSGVGTLTGLAYMLTLGDRDRFKKSRDVGAYFGLVPRQQQSSNADPQLRISKAGDGLVRKLLVGSAHYILGRFGPDSDLRRWGLALAERGGKNGKKRAVVAVARKLAVLLHRLWVTGEAYEPLRSKREKTPQLQHKDPAADSPEQPPAERGETPQPKPNAAAADSPEQPPTERSKPERSKRENTPQRPPKAPAADSREQPPAKAVKPERSKRKIKSGESPMPCGELRGRPTRVENPRKRPRKGGRVSHTLPAHIPLHTA